LVLSALTQTKESRSGIALHKAGITIGMMRTISLKLPEDLLAELEREAKARHITTSVLVREILQTVLGRKPSRRGASCYYLARDLAGSVKELPRDLAHKPKYMEGFGE
jgi:hypothetical protein